jgi:hypothetical protein
MNARLSGKPGNPLDRHLQVGFPPQMGEEETELATMSAQIQNIVDRFRL